MILTRSGGGVETKSTSRFAILVGTLFAVTLLVAACSTPKSRTPFIFADFSQLPDGPAPDRFTSGQPASVWSPDDPSWRLRIEQGRLTYDPTTPARAAGYFRTPDMGSPITRIGMEWTVEPRPNGGPGIAALGVMGAPVNPSADRSTPLALHFTVVRDGWNYSVSPGKLGEDSRLVTLGEGVFDPPLVEDGITVHRAEVTLDGPNATIQLPNASTERVSDPRIAEWAGRFGFFEVFSQSGSADGRVGLVRVWAGT